MSVHDAIIQILLIVLPGLILVLMQESNRRSS
jgi:hypothetical protein